MLAPLSWKSPIVSPFANISKVFLSSSGIFSMSISTFSCCFTLSTASASIERCRSDDDAGGVDADVSGATLNLHRHIYDGLDVFVLFVEGFELRRHFHSALNGHGKSLRAEGD